MEHTYYDQLSQLPPITTTPPPISTTRNRSRSEDDVQTEILVCHDYKGGYLKEELPYQSCCCSSPNTHIEELPYSFARQWQYFDYFIYFSHRRVTIPPLAYRQAAKQHQVPILGTLIFEHQDGSQDLLKLLKPVVESNNSVLSNSSIKSKFHYVNVLANLAKLHQFDGYLINIEAPFPASSIPQREARTNVIRNEMYTYSLSQIWSLAHFMADLSRYVPYVICYDAMTWYNAIHWQNCLSPSNFLYYWACKGWFFTNYTWSSVGYLQQSKALAQSIRFPSSRIFTGIDVFGRGSFEGGQLNTHKALEVIRKEGTSCALFAPGWTFENFSTDEERLRTTLTFWQSIFPPSHLEKYPKRCETPWSTNEATGQLYFYTNFASGYSFSPSFALRDLNTLLHESNADGIKQWKWHLHAWTKPLPYNLSYDGNNDLQRRGYALQLNHKEAFLGTTHLEVAIRSPSSTKIPLFTFAESDNAADETQPCQLRVAYKVSSPSTSPSVVEFYARSRDNKTFLDKPTRSEVVNSWTVDTFNLSVPISKVAEVGASSPSQSANEPNSISNSISIGEVYIGPPYDAELRTTITLAPITLKVGKSAADFVEMHWDARSNAWIYLVVLRKSNTLVGVTSYHGYRFAEAELQLLELTTGRDHHGEDICNQFKIITIFQDGSIQL